MQSISYLVCLAWPEFNDHRLDGRGLPTTHAARSLLFSAGWLAVPPSAGGPAAGCSEERIALDWLGSALLGLARDGLDHLSDDLDWRVYC